MRIGRRTELRKIQLLPNQTMRLAGLMGSQNTYLCKEFALSDLLQLRLVQEYLEIVLAFPYFLYKTCVGLYQINICCAL